MAGAQDTIDLHGTRAATQIQTFGMLGVFTTPLVVAACTGVGALTGHLIQKDYVENPMFITAEKQKLGYASALVVTAGVGALVVVNSDSKQAGTSHGNRQASK